MAKPMKKASRGAKKQVAKAARKPAAKAVKASPKKQPAKKTLKPKTRPKAAPKVKAGPRSAPKAAPKGKGKTAVKARAGKRGSSVSVVRESPTRKRAGLSKEDLDYFKRVLNEKRGRIVEKARDTLSEGMKLDEADLPDEYDMASSEYLQYFTLRLRGRERYFLDKIERALQRIDEGTFGVCEVCGDEIGMARLMARPETTLCIRCKETQEREERQFSE
jgi:DnaK suppressor protein